LRKRRVEKAPGVRGKNLRRNFQGIQERGEGWEFCSQMGLSGTRRKITSAPRMEKGRKCGNLLEIFEFGERGR